MEVPCKHFTVIFATLSYWINGLFNSWLMMQPLAIKLMGINAKGK